MICIVQIELIGRDKDTPRQCPIALPNAEGSDTTEGDSSTTVDNKIKLFDIKEFCKCPEGAT